MLTISLCGVINHGSACLREPLDGCKRRLVGAIYEHLFGAYLLAVCAYSKLRVARRRANRAPSLTISTSDCAVLLRSWRTKRSGIMREMSLSMRVPSVSPCGAVPWVPSNEVQGGNGIGETP